MIPTPKKISELSPVPALSNLDLLVFVDRSDISASPQGTTKKGTFGQVKENILNSISLPKATNQNAGAVVVGDGLSIDANGVLRTKFSGSYTDLTNKPSLISNLSDLSNVQLSSINEGGHTLFYDPNLNGGVWVNRRIRYEDLTQIPTDIVTENSSVTLQDVSILGNLIVTGTTISNNFETLNVGTSEIILNDQLGKFVGDAEADSAVISEVDNAYSIQTDSEILIAANGGPLTLPPGTKVQSILSPTEVLLTNPFQGNGSTTEITFEILIQPASNAAIIVNRSAENDSQIRWNELNNAWEFTNNGDDFYAIPLPDDYGNYNNLLNTPTIPEKIEDLSNVSSSLTPSDTSPFLRWDGNNYSPSAIDSVDLSEISVNALKDVNTTNPPTPGQVLEWDGDAWSPASYSVGGLTTGAGEGDDDAKLALTGADNNSITFQGADGLSVEQLDENTLIFRAPSTSDAQYTDSMAKDAVAAALDAGTHVGITFTYDIQNKQISSTVSGDTAVLYDLGVSNTTTNQAIISLTPSSGEADTFEIVGVGGTTVSWDETEKKVSITSTAPVQPDWNATTGLGSILNKPTIPEQYNLPAASDSTLGGVKIDNTTITISDGVISAAQTVIENIDDLSNVTITSISDEQLLVFNQETNSWINKKLDYSSLGNIPDNIVLEDTSVTLADLTLTGNLIVTGTTISNNFETLNVGTSEIILNDQLGKYTGTATPGSTIISNMSTTFNIDVGNSVRIISNGGDLTLAEDAIVTQIDNDTQIRLSRSFFGSDPVDNVVFEIKVNPLVNASILVNRSKEPNSEIRWDETNNRWKFSNDGINFYNLPVPSEYGDFTKLINVPSIPSSLSDLSDVGSDTPEDAHILSFNGTSWGPRALAASDFSSISISAFKDIVIGDDDQIVNGSVLRWNGSGWAPRSDLVIVVGEGDETVSGAIVTPDNTSSKISFYYASIDGFPDASKSLGAFAYAESGGGMYYAHDNKWLELALASNVQPNTDTLYTLGSDALATDTNSGNGAKIKITPSDNNIDASHVTLYGDGGVSISRAENSDLITVSGRTYTIKAAAADGENDSKINLEDSRESDNVTSILLQGADGLKIEKVEDENTLIFRAPASSASEYTDNQAKDAAAAMIDAGTHVGISWQYDTTAKTLSSTVSGGGGGGGGAILYALSLTGENNTEPQIILSNSVNVEDKDIITIAGSGGTSVSYSTEESKITITSTAPVQSNWNETNSSSLAFIANKPTIPDAYNLPTASNTALGGVKIDGKTITILDGVISAAAGGYVLPMASDTVLGGIKIGSGLAIDENGSVSVSAGGGTPLQVRNTILKTTSSIQPNGVEELVFTDGYKTYMLLKLLSSSDAWVRVYVNQEAMIADRYRSEGNDPIPGSGVIADVRTSDEVVFTPIATGFNNDSPVSDNIYVSVTNRDLEARAIQVSLVILRLEA